MKKPPPPAATGLQYLFKRKHYRFRTFGQNAAVLQSCWAILGIYQLTPWVRCSPLITDVRTMRGLAKQLKIRSIKFVL